MNRVSILEKQVEDNRVVEEHQIAPGYVVVVREEHGVLEIYAVTSKQTRHITTALTIEQARAEVKIFAEEHKAWMAKRRAGQPTPAQLAALFRWKIPIAADLTYGQAWDTIAAKVEQDQQKRAAERRAKLRLVDT